MKVSLGSATIALPLPAWVICSYDDGGRANAMTASWTGICNSDPPCAYFSVRRSRYTYGCLVSQKAFTINIPNRNLAAATDFFGTVSGRDQDKIATAGLTAVPAEHVFAPYIEQFPLILECQLLNMLELGSHTMFIGEIVEVKCDEEALNAEGRPDGAALAPFVYCTADSTYYAVTEALGGGYRLGAVYKTKD